LPFGSDYYLLATHFTQYQVTFCLLPAINVIMAKISFVLDYIDCFSLEFLIKNLSMQIGKRKRSHRFLTLGSVFGYPIWWLFLARYECVYLCVQYQRLLWKKSYYKADKRFESIKKSFKLNNVNEMLFCYCDSCYSCCDFGFYSVFYRFVNWSLGSSRCRSASKSAIST